MPSRFYEDLEVGESFTFGDYTVSKEEIVDFAEQFDPQSFHVDEKAAENSIYGGIIASGWHTAALCTRLVVKDVFDNIAAMGGRGVDDLRWHAPVRPGDTLSGNVSVSAKRSSETHLDRGYVNFDMELRTQNDALVMSMTNRGMIRRHETKGESTNF